MKRIIYWGTALGLAAFLAACGGGDATPAGSIAPAGAPTTKGSFSAVVSFGDSLSDVGTYTPATSMTGNGAPPFLGGKFTNNSATSSIWVENLAASLGVAITPAEMGFAGQSAPCPFVVNCTAYGQGGSRVTDPNGIGRSTGALTVPMKTQIANHLARFSSFKATDLITVFGGANDVFTQFGGFVAAATQIQTDAAAGKLNAEQANLALFAAQSKAQGEMKKAALELAGYVRDQILAKGGKYVVVITLPDIADTPFGNSLPASVRPSLTDLSLVFNLWLRDGLGQQPVQIIDAFAMFKDLYANPGKYGLTNNTVPACDATKIKAITGGAVQDGSSLFCNSTAGAPYNGLRAGADVNTWQFADGVHPTTRVHKIFSDAIAAQLKSFGWL